MNKPDTLNETEAKSDLSELQKKYGALIVNFNNQQAELAKALKHTQRLEAENERLEQQLALGRPMSSDESQADLSRENAKLQQTIQSLETMNMQLQKKVNKLQVEHVSEEEVDQLFFALEQKEQQLKQVEAEKKGMEDELNTARQLTARGTNVAPKYVEIHHSQISDDDSDDASG